MFRNPVPGRSVRLSAHATAPIDPQQRSDPATASILLPDPATILPRDDPVTPQITLERSTDVPERSWHAPGRSRTLQNDGFRTLRTIVRSIKTMVLAASARSRDCIDSYC